MDPQDQLGRRANRDLKVQRVIMDVLDLPVYQEILVRRDSPESLALQDQRVNVEKLGQWDRQDHQGRMAPLALRVSRVQWVLKVNRDKMDQQVFPAHRDHLVLLDPRVAYSPTPRSSLVRITSWLSGNEEVSSNTQPSLICLTWNLTLKTP